MKGLVASWLVQEMDKRQLSVKQLVLISGVSRGEIYNLRNENRQRPRIETCNALAGAFEMHSAELMAQAGLIPPLPKFYLPYPLDDADLELVNAVIHLRPEAKKHLAGLLQELG